MAKSKEVIKKDIKEYIQIQGQGVHGWYIGIAENVKQRLFNDHNVDEENGVWIYSLASSSYTAREIEIELLEELNTKGGTGGGSDDTDFVYAYKITNYTKE